ncbi:MAG: hypothetical protein IZT56_13500 [Bacteroidetes bacterium]|nr:hypothetical protein [Bacteroidota bacterium]
MIAAIFKSFDNGYFTFFFETGGDMVFEEIHPKALYKFDLRNDTSYINKEFHLNFSEVVEDTDSVIYRIDSLKLI